MSFISPTKDFISLKLNLRQKRPSFTGKPVKLDIVEVFLNSDQIHTDNHNTDLRTATQRKPVLNGSGLNEKDRSVVCPMTDLL